ncbi:MAG: hypothetical protein RLZZ507_724 [Cyanobacteriota bacterium]|jgi:hypothetical protein
MMAWTWVKEAKGYREGEKFLFLAIRLFMTQLFLNLRLVIFDLGLQPQSSINCYAFNLYSIGGHDFNCD